MTALTKVPETELWASFPEATRNGILGIAEHAPGARTVRNRVASARGPHLRRTVVDLVAFLSGERLSFFILMVAGRHGLVTARRVSRGTPIARWLSHTPSPGT